MQDRNFKLGTTSFIIPDHILPNVEKLGPWFDEIELLVFESQPEYVLPTKDDVEKLVHLSEQFQVTYNVHLPADVSLSRGSADERKKAQEVLLNVLDRLKPLNATTHTLHLEMPQSIQTGSGSGPDHTRLIENWADQVEKSLDQFLLLLDDPDSLTIETLEYPFSAIEPLVRRLQLPICIDIGHGIKYQYDWFRIFQTDIQKVPLVHLHGVDFSGSNPKDHVGLDRLPENHMTDVFSFLERYTGVVSLEVFNLKYLNNSLQELAMHFNDIPKLDFY